MPPPATSPVASQPRLRARRATPRTAPDRVICVCEAELRSRPRSACRPHTTRTRRRGRPAGPIWDAIRVRLANAVAPVPSDPRSAGRARRLWRATQPGESNATRGLAVRRATTGTRGGRVRAAHFRGSAWIAGVRPLAGRTRRRCVPHWAHGTHEGSSRSRTSRGHGPTVLRRVERWLRRSPVATYRGALGFGCADEEDARRQGGWLVGPPSARKSPATSVNRAPARRRFAIAPWLPGQAWSPEVGE